MRLAARLAGSALAALVAFGAPAAPAADAPADAALIAACLDRAAATGGARDACIDLVAAPCIAAPGGETTVGMSACLGRERDAWDVLLNRYWQPLMARARETDAGGGAGAAETLRAAQRAWLAFRDAECQHAAARWGMGSMRLIDGVACLGRLTALRAIEFHARLNDGG